MDRKELLEKLKALPFGRGQYWLITGGAMVLYGLREQTHDIDLGCTTELADSLQARGCDVTVQPDGTRKLRWGEDTELFENWVCGTVDRVCGIPVVSLEGLAQMKRGLGREKDLRDVALIEAYQKTVFLETRRLILRRVRESDLDGYFREHLGDKELDRLMGRWPCSSEEEIRAGFDWFLNREKRAYVLVEKASLQVVGNLTVYDRVPDCVSKHPATADKRGRSLSFATAAFCRRAGFMREAVSAVIAHLFAQENTDYVNCGHFAFNTPSAEFQRALGFRPLLTEMLEHEGERFVLEENILWRSQMSQ